MKCPECGRESPADRRQCGFCGADMRVPPRPTDTLQDASTRPAGGGEVAEPTLGAADTILSRELPTRPGGPQASVAGVLLGGQFRILEDRPIGAGGMGEVWKAHDMQLDVTVAVKVLAPALASDPQAVEGLRREAILGRELRHANLCQLYGLYSHAKIRFLVMEYVHGRTLADLLGQEADHRIDWQRLRPIARQIADVLDYAHSTGGTDAQGELFQGVLHRDLKPQNIIVADDGTAKLADFGIASAIPVVWTRSRRPGGLTPVYASPEQLRGETCTRASDLYSFAAVLYECLAGRPPVDPAGDVRAQVLGGEYRPIPAEGPGVNDALRRALSEDRRRRPATARELVDCLERAMSEPAPTAAGPARPAGPPASGPRRWWRLKSVRIAAALAVLLTVVLGWVLYKHFDGTGPPVDATPPGPRGANWQALAAKAPPGTPELVAQLLSRDWDTANRAFHKLRASGPKAKRRAVPLLIEVLKTRREEPCTHAGRLLKDFGPEARDAVDALIAVVADPALGETSHGARSAALQALGAMGPAAKDAVPVIIRTLDDPRFGARADAAEALGNIGLITDEVVTCLLRALSRARQDGPALQAAIMRALARCGPKAEPALVGLIDRVQSAHPEEAQAAALAVGSIGPPARKAVPYLLEHLRMCTWQTYLTRCWALSRIAPNNPRVETALGRQLQNLEDHVRQSTAESGPYAVLAAETLGNMARAAEDAVDALATGAWTGTPKVRAACLRALGRIAPAAPSTRAAVLKARNDPDPAVRQAAAQALKKIQPAYAPTTRAVPRLEKSQ